MQYFWTYETDLPAGVGFAHFDAAHILWLAAIFVAGLLGVRRFAACSDRLQHKIQAMVGGAILAVELVQDGYLAMQGHLDVQQLPLHLCGLAVFLTAGRNALMFMAVNREKTALQPGARERHEAGRGGVRRVVAYLGDVQYALCMPGALAALVFPDWTWYPPISFMSLVGFGNHALLVFSGACLCVQPYFRIHIRNLWRPVTFLLGIVPIMYAFDMAFQVNYMFLRWGPEDSPLAKLGGGAGAAYLCEYGVLVLAVMALWYLSGMLVTWCRHTHTRR